MEQKLLYYHAYTNGLSKNLLFKDEQDFIVGMNSIPVCLSRSGVDVLCFCLMSNHVHFILQGEYEECKHFMGMFKKLRGMKLVSKYGEGYNTKEAEIGIKAIGDDDYLRAAIGYVLRNPMAAGMKIMPSEYSWSSIGAYFAKYSLLDLRSIASLSVRERYELLSSRHSYPDDYLLRTDGAIHPISYVNNKFVERLFYSPKQLLYYLSVNKDLEFELQNDAISGVDYTDQQLFACLDDCAKTMFNINKYEKLPIERRFLVAKELRKRYRAKAKQIARVTGLEYELLKRYL